MPENRFNLIDEPWIPVVDVGRVSLQQLFSQPHYRALGGNPVQKIALTKLLLAIAQSACTPADDREWADLKPSGLAKKCLSYLDQWYDRFFLFGNKPFLQMPAIKAAAIQPFGAVLPEVSTGNTTVLTQGQIERPMTDADKALLVVQLMGFGLGGKADNSVNLSPGYQGKLNSKGNVSVSLPGASLGKMGYLHNFLQGHSLQETLWLNLLTQKLISDLRMYQQGLGTAPWEQMPVGENDSLAEALKSSLIGRLVPVSHFIKLSEKGLHYSEGLAHPGYKEGVVDPSVSVDFSGKDPKVIWVDPNKRPWRQLTALLSFLSQTSSNTFDCYQLRFCIGRAVQYINVFDIWSGGLRVSGGGTNKQYIAVSDDFVESAIQLNSAIVGELWFANLQLEMDELEKLSKMVYGATFAYFKSQNMESKGQAAQAGNLFWQLCERRFQELVLACDSSEQAHAMRPGFARFVNKAYDTYCPRDTARQLDAWARNCPNLGKYLQHLNKEEAA
ncbi:MAG: type I-E CRISPR-associated protein Cse1/CasA [Thermodesulfobacteriota bacterium]|nr:type I-E CRISPR-associated protein Cse1/CasA [Thermodesulfobacteriota bacterium]